MDPSKTSQLNDDLESLIFDEIVIPSSLKFVIAYIKLATWRSQILKFFRANGFSGFLDGSTLAPEKIVRSEDRIPKSNVEYRCWMRMDQNLAATLCSTISATVLSYVLGLESCADIWSTVEKRLQASNRSRVIQLKNELHNSNEKSNHGSIFDGNQISRGQHCCIWSKDRH